MEHELDKKYEKAESAYNSNNITECITMCEEILKDAKGWGRLQFLVLLGRVFNQIGRFAEGLELSNEGTGFVMKGKCHPQTIVNRIAAQSGLMLKINMCDLRTLQVHPSYLVESLLFLVSNSIKDPPINTILNDITLDVDSKRAIYAISQNDPTLIFGIKTKLLQPMLSSNLCRIIVNHLHDDRSKTLKQSKELLVYFISICDETYLKRESDELNAIQMQLLTVREISIVKTLQINNNPNAVLLGIAILENDRQGVRKWLEYDSSDQVEGNDDIFAVLESYNYSRTPEKMSKKNSVDSKCDSSQLLLLGNLVVKLHLEDRVVAMTSGSNDVKRLSLLQSIACHPDADLPVICTSLLNIAQRSLCLSEQTVSWWMTRLFETNNPELLLLSYKMGTLYKCDCGGLRQSSLLKAAAARNYSALQLLKTVPGIGTESICKTILGTPISESWSLLYVAQIDISSLEKSLRVAIENECLESIPTLLRWYVDVKGITPSAIQVYQNIPKPVKSSPDFNYVSSLFQNYKTAIGGDQSKN